MQSSPAFRSSPPPNPQEVAEDTPVLSITLVREEDLDELRKSYESVTSIHVYSLGPTPIKDMQTLSDTSREILEKHTTQDPLETASTYGTIINKGVRRRTGLRPPPIAAATPPPTLKAKTSSLKEETKAPSSSKPKQEAQSSRASSKPGKDFFGKGTIKKENPTPKDSLAPSTSAPLKRGSSGGIFASFAKAKPKVKREGTDTSDASPAVSAVASAAEDSPMKDVSDDEEETYVPPPQKAKEIVDSDRKSRKEREAALAKMMEDDDENVESPAIAAETPEEDGREMEDPPASQVPKEYVEVSGGRRRGRRRVMKKKTMKDEEGYLGRCRVTANTLHITDIWQ
jgi:DNA polymerase delta subunit 3